MVNYEMVKRAEWTKLYGHATHNSDIYITVLDWLVRPLLQSCGSCVLEKNPHWCDDSDDHP
jgi:hypothetical protein